MADLTSRTCKPCEGGIPALSPDEVRQLLTGIGGWQLDGDGRRIGRTFRFRNYYETMAFVNAVAWMAHRENHHPDLEVGFDRCLVSYTTHAISGLSENDFICAAKVNRILGSD
jgi:4a-hydroxytetrahydrobiopterin dehydratase